MKKLLFGILVLTFVALSPSLSSSVSCQGCATIQGGTILDSAGNVIRTGYDDWGYNYQSRGYNGLYGNYSRPATPLTEDSCGGWDCDSLEMKWNDAWLSNMDCDDDGKLDRPSPYIGSGAWITNHMSGTYEYLDDKGRTKDAHWTYFVKIVAVPADAVLSVGVWYDAEGTEIGPEIWDQFAIIQSVYNDPVGGFHGKEYLSPVNPGLGSYK